MSRSLCERASPSAYGKFMPYIALAILVALTIWAWNFYKNVSKEKERRRFNEYVADMSRAITSRLDSHRMVLQGGAGLFAASEEVTREEWQTYYTYQEIHTLYPGIQGIVYSPVVNAADLQAHIAGIRAEGFPDYTVWPAGERDEYVPVIFAEPFDERNQRAFGFDIASEPVRHAAMVRARDTGLTSLSQKVVLVTEASDEMQPGFLMYVPIYASGMPTTSVAERRTAIRGYVFAPFRMHELMHGLFPQANGKVAIEIHDGTERSADSLMYAHASFAEPAPPTFSASETLDLYGQPWSLRFRTLQAFDAGVDRHTSRSILAAGLVISLLIFLFLKMLHGSEGRAIARAEQMTSALRASEERQNHLLSVSPAIIYTLDPRDLSRSWVSPNVKVLLGYDANAALQSGWWAEHLHEEDRERAREQTASVLTTGYVDHEYRFIKEDGSVCWVYDRLRLLRDAAGTPFEVIGTWTDITARKKAEANLLESEAYNRSIIGVLPDTILRADGNGTCLDIITPCEAMLVLPRAELLGRDLAEVFPPAAAAELKTCIRKTLEFGRLQTAEFAWEISGEDRHFEARLLPRNDDEVIALIRDVTAQKQAVEDQVAREAADTANRAKSMFLSNMSHEIRTPMNAILGFAQILERDPSLDPRQRDQVGSINRAGRHLLTLINDILDMSKIEAGMTVANPAVFALHDLLDDLQMMFQSRADAKNLHLLMERAEDVPYHVLGDEGKLRQVMVNLMGNAVKFTSAGGVAVRVRTEPVDAQSGPNVSVRLVVEVEDSGPGIDSDDLERIFDAFRQADNGLKAGGTGLGLAISSRLVEMMGGKLTVSSEPGKGSCFRFHVLLELVDEVPQAEQTDERLVVGLEPGQGPFRILVADDTQGNRELLCDLLRPLGFEIRAAINGAEALQIYEDWAPHAVLMDMRMPIMDGYEATRRIKASTGGSDTPVIAVTASAFNDAVTEVMAAGVSAYVRKPFRPEELFDALGECLDLRYVYADQASIAQRHPKEPPLTQADLANLPTQQLLDLREAVADGDIAHLTDLILDVEKQDAKVAAALQALADRYDYETLDTLLGGTEHA